MATKTAAEEMMAAREAIAIALEAKIGNMPEWKAYRAADRALLALALLDPKPLKAASAPPENQKSKSRINGEQIPYMVLADRALAESGRPLSTDKMVEYIAKHRPLTGDPKKKRIVIQSSLSKSKSFDSVPWDDGRAWWYANKPVPKKETAT